MRRYRRRFKRRARVPRTITPASAVITVRRTGAVTTGTLVAGVYNIVVDPSISAVNTGDLTAMFDHYRVRKVIVHVTPQIDPANSGVANNSTYTIAAACTTEAVAAPTSLQIVTSYNNAYIKTVAAGGTFQYTFVPSVVNTIDASGVATAAGTYSRNPWIQCDSSGITIPHRRLLLWAQSSVTTLTTKLDIWYEFFIDLKGIS